MEERFNPSEIEKKWQAIWEEEGTFRAEKDLSKEKYYVLEMFPYPSGRIHMGHVRNYSIGDVIARFKRMQGFNVLHPMGWDAFGLPAENAAIQNRSHPAKWTYENIEYMRRQLKKMGFAYDWSREIATCHPDYYRWEQLIFIRMYERGLVYKKKSSVNWCEKCLTVLANEQVSSENLCWRCDEPVKERELDQWFFKISEYADELLEYIYKLKGWPERVLTMQSNWIGRSEGAEIDFKVDGCDENIKVFTTRPDTLFGATFMSLAPEHPMVAKLSKGTEQENDVKAFVEKMKSLDKISRTDETGEKEGVFTGGYAVNPVNGEKIPVYTANFVLMEYGTGAVMAVPAHDQRDFEFAKKYDIPIRVVIEPPNKNDKNAEKPESAQPDAAYTEPGIMINSGQFNGMNSEEAKTGITEYLAGKGCGKRTVNFRLRDWGVSRQRYWGAPIPMINCKNCGTVPVSEKELPVRLPEDIDFDVKEISPLAGMESFVNTVCRLCGGDAERETDTMDTFVESSWYYARYTSPRCTKGPLDREETDYWLPVDQYIGGIEHAVMHLLYARFFHKVLRDLGMISGDEPFKNLLTQGMVCMESRRCKNHGWLSPEEVKDGNCLYCGIRVIKGRTEKMSKSKKNTIDPDDLIGYYGADTVRLFSLFASPPEKDLEWNETGVEGAYRFLGRVWRMVYDRLDIINEQTGCGAGADGNALGLRRKTHQTVKKVTEDIGERFHLNTAISAVMELVNSIYLFRAESEEDKSVLAESVETVVLLISPFVPHISEELWRIMGKKGRAANAEWPGYNDAYTVEDEITVVIQVNGKVRGRIQAPADSSDEDLRNAAMNDNKVKAHLEGKDIRKIIVVPGKLVNIVVGK